MDETKSKLKKISDSVYELAKETDMKVKAKLILNKKLFDNVEEGSVRQIRNVTTLPGIQKHAIAMSDMHYGYGFPIGGVAAFDEETGIITPGGIGFDINCLARDSRILSSHGCYKPIQDFESDFIEVETGNSEYSLKAVKGIQRFVSLDTDNKSISSQTGLYFMKRKHSGSILQIKTKLGYTIQVTDDHPIMTKAGMVKAKDARKGQQLAVYPFTGVEYQEIEDDKMLVDDEVFTKQEKDELRKRNLLSLSLTNPKLPVIARLFGYLLGDGNIYISGQKGFVNAYGCEEDLEEIKEDFKELGFSASIYSRKRAHNIPTRYGAVVFTATNCELHVSSKALAKLFFELGYPSGKKTSSPVAVPEWIMNSPLWIKRLFLSGFFGAELSSPRTHTKTGFDCPTISQNKNSAWLENGREFAIQLMMLLEEFGIKTHKLLQTEDYKNKEGPTTRLRIQISSEEDNLLRLWERVGFSYNKKRDILSQIAILYIKNKKLLSKKRTETADKVKELRIKGLTLKEVQRLLESQITNKRFIQRHYYEKAGQRITLDFPSFREFSEQKFKEILDYGCLFDELAAIEKKPYKDYVYDFNISKTHNFVANNIIVSNCGVRLLATNLTKEEVEPKIKELLNVMFRNVPSGVGSESFIRLSDGELNDVLKNGAKWAVKQGYGNEDDLEHCEENGCMHYAEPSKVTPKAKSRGRDQLGTLGAGNHFLEVQIVDEIYNPKIAKVFGITEKGQITVMIHCGSRGLGHQVCSDYLRKMEDAYPEIMAKLPEKDLIYAPLQSQLAKDYFGAMCASANYAWANRHIIAHQIRKSFKQVFGDKAELKTVYDVAHNIAKLEEHDIDGNKRKLYVHRKGATRAFPAGNPDIPKAYSKVGQPVIIPGSMGTASYVLVGTEKAMEETFGSTAHGAGRTMSRNEAIRTFRGEKVRDDLEKQHIYLKSGSWKGVSEEAPQAYKDIDEVIKATESAGIAEKVVRLRPLGVIKG